MSKLEYPVAEPPTIVYRVARGDTPLALRPSESVTEETPLNGRFDDSYGSFRTLYVAGSKEAALRETLQDFRSGALLAQRLRHIESNAEELTDPEPSDYIGVIPVSWLAERCLGVMEVVKPCHCVNVTSAAAIDKLCTFKARSITVSDLLAEDVNLTQSLSRFFWNHRDAYCGVAYSSKLGGDLTNYALFETAKDSNVLRATLRLIETQPLRSDDPELVDVANAMGLQLPGLEALNAAAELVPGAVPAYEHLRAALTMLPFASVALHRMGHTHIYVAEYLERTYIFTAGIRDVAVVAIGPDASVKTIWKGALYGARDLKTLHDRLRRMLPGAERAKQIVIVDTTDALMP